MLSQADSPPTDKLASVGRVATAADFVSEWESKEKLEQIRKGREQKQHRRVVLRKIALFVVVTTAVAGLSAWWIEKWLWEQELSKDTSRLEEAKQSLDEFKKKRFYPEFLPDDLTRFSDQLTLAATTLRALEPRRHDHALHDQLDEQLKSALESCRQMAPRLQRYLEVQIRKSCPRGHPRLPEYRACQFDAYPFPFWKSGNTVHWQLPGWTGSYDLKSAPPACPASEDRP